MTSYLSITYPQLQMNTSITTKCCLHLINTQLECVKSLQLSKHWIPLKTHYEPHLSRGVCILTTQSCVSCGLERLYPISLRHSAQSQSARVASHSAFAVTLLLRPPGMQGGWFAVCNEFGDYDHFGIWCCYKPRYATCQLQEMLRCYWHLDR